MSLRAAFIIALAASGLAIPMEPASAQYSYPQGGYRGVPDRDGVMTLEPNDARQPARGGAVSSQPLAPLPGSSSAPIMVEREPMPAPYETRSSDNRPYDARPSDVRPDIQSMPQQPMNTAPDGYGRPPAYGAMPPYNDRSYTPGYGRPDDAPRQTYRPPADVDVNRPPAALGSTTPSGQQQVRPGTMAALPPDDQPEDSPTELAPQFRRQIVSYQTKEPAGTIIIDTPSTFLYYVNGDGTALRYGIGVGREGFTWAGSEKISRMAEWPDWHPPAEMIERQPYLPRFMAGGPGNPLGARALYLGKTIYRVHGTNQPSTIGKTVSSGCIRMLNEDVQDLYGRVKVGSKVVVLGSKGPTASNTSATR